MATGAQHIDKQLKIKRRKNHIEKDNEKGIGIRIRDTKTDLD
jgi:hypothetical protein